jgi:protein gp37
VGDKSKIEWTEATWNPVIGCSKVSPGCAHCYAEELHRTRLAGVGAYPVFKPWTPENAEHNVTLVPRKLDEPLRWTKPRMVFVNSMSDMFHELVPTWYIARVWAVMCLAKHHTFQVLTKRPDRMRDILLWGEFPDMVLSQAKKMADEGVLPRTYADVVSSLEFIPTWLPALPLPNVWLGTSIENRRFVHRADELRATPAAIRFISAEPLLGPLVHDDYADNDVDGGHSRWSDVHRYSGHELDLKDIDWLIVGGESGPNHRPIQASWVHDLRNACKYGGRGCPCDRGETTPFDCRSCPGPEGTAFFFKQWGGRTPKAGGRELDGRTYDEMPAGAATATV